MNVASVTVSATTQGLIAGLATTCCLGGASARITAVATQQPQENRLGITLSRFISSDSSNLRLMRLFLRYADRKGESH
jgi:hypothetical protein